jgi:predicted secreted protein
MSWFTGIIVFLLIWWTVIFTVLPFGLRRDETGKPDDPRLAHKALLTTGISVLLWLAVYALIEAGIINFYNMAGIMAGQDGLR